MKRKYLIISIIFVVGIILFDSLTFPYLSDEMVIDVTILGDRVVFSKAIAYTGPCILLGIVLVMMNVVKEHHRVKYLWLSSIIVFINVLTICLNF